MKSAAKKLDDIRMKRTMKDLLKLIEDLEHDIEKNKSVKFYLNDTLHSDDKGKNPIVPEILKLCDELLKSGKINECVELLQDSFQGDQLWKKASYYLPKVYGWNTVIRDVNQSNNDMSKIRDALFWFVNLKAGELEVEQISTKVDGKLKALTKGSKDELSPLVEMLSEYDAQVKGVQDRYKAAFDFLNEDLADPELSFEDVVNFTMFEKMTLPQYIQKRMLEGFQGNNPQVLDAILKQVETLTGTFHDELSKAVNESFSGEKEEDEVIAKRKERIKQKIEQIQEIKKSYPVGNEDGNAALNTAVETLQNYLAVNDNLKNFSTLKENLEGIDSYQKLIDFKNPCAGGLEALANGHFNVPTENFTNYLTFAKDAQTIPAHSFNASLSGLAAQVNKVVGFLQGTVEIKIDKLNQFSLESVNINNKVSEIRELINEDVSIRTSDAVVDIGEGFQKIIQGEFRALHTSLDAAASALKENALAHLIEKNAGLVEKQLFTLQPGENSILLTNSGLSGDIKNQLVDKLKTYREQFKPEGLSLDGELELYLIKEIKHGELSTSEQIINSHIQQANTILTSRYKEKKEQFIKVLKETINKAQSVSDLDGIEIPPAVKNEAEDLINDKKESLVQSKLEKLAVKVKELQKSVGQDRKEKDPIKALLNDYLHTADNELKK